MGTIILVVILVLIIAAGMAFGDPPDRGDYI